jgi:hypothetical protein
MRDNALISKIDYVLDRADHYLTDMAYLNVTQGMIDALQDARDAFDAVNSDPMANKGELKTINTNIHNLIKSGMTFLDEHLDYTIFTVKNTYEWYFDRYWNIRAVYDLGIRHKSGVVFVVRDSVKNHALQNAVINVPNDQGLTEKKTGKNGKENFVLKEGDYTYSVTLKDYTTATGSFTIKKDEPTVVIVTMVKS